MVGGRLTYQGRGAQLSVTLAGLCAECSAVFGWPRPIWRMMTPTTPPRRVITMPAQKPTGWAITEASTRTGQDRYRTQAERSFRTFAHGLQTNPTGMTAMAEALAMFLDATAKK